MCKTNSSETTEDVDLLPMLWVIANSYKACFEECVNIETNSEICNFIPIVTNGNFAIELYLKFIKGYEQIEKSFKQTFSIRKTHNLYKLFCSLNGKTRNKLIEALQKNNVQQNDFITYLKNNGEDFVAWRYPLRNSATADLNILSQMIDVLYEYCKLIINGQNNMSKISLDKIGGYSIKITL